jgi:signal peptidase I
MCFVLGDNLRNSRDSRHYGLVALGDILGVAEYIYLPADSWSRFGRLP